MTEADQMRAYIKSLGDAYNKSQTENDHLKAENEQLKKRVAELEGDAEKITTSNIGLEATIFKGKDVTLDLSMYENDTFLEVEEVGRSLKQIAMHIKTVFFVEQLKNIIAAHELKFNDSRKE